MKFVLDHKNFERFGERKYQKAREHGIDSVSYAMCDTNTLFYKAPVDDSDELLYKERIRAEKDGYVFSHCHGPWRVPWPDVKPDGLREKVEETKRMLHNTKTLGAKYCVVHPFLPNDYEHGDPEKCADTWKQNKAILNELLEVAHKEDVSICFENMPMNGFSLAKPDAIQRMCDEINDDHLMVCFDSGHANIYPELKMDECLKTVSSRVRVLHVHDNFYNVDMHLLPFCGNTNWKAFSQGLKDIDYQHMFEMEFSLSERLNLELSEDVLRILKKTYDYILSLAD